MVAGALGLGAQFGLALRGRLGALARLVRARRRVFSGGAQLGLALAGGPGLRA